MVQYIIIINVYYILNIITCISFRMASSSTYMFSMYVLFHNFSIFNLVHYVYYHELGILQAIHIRFYYIEVLPFFIKIDFLYDILLH